MDGVLGVQPSGAGEQEAGRPGECGGELTTGGQGDWGLGKLAQKSFEKRGRGRPAQESSWTGRVMGARAESSEF